MTVLDPEDIQACLDHGLPAGEAERQLALLESGVAPVRLARPCTAGDGLTVLTTSEADRLVEAWPELGRSCRLVKFVPASGAASRMFSALSGVLGEGDPPGLDELKHAGQEGSADAALVAEFAERVSEFAFYEELALRVGASAEPSDTGHAYLGYGRGLLSAEGLDYARLPKGLLAFHLYADGSRTPLEEQLFEAAGYAASSDGCCRLHLTVSGEHLGAFEELVARVAPLYEQRFGLRFELSFSEQKASTDSLSVDDDGGLFCVEGVPLFRAGGHGALIANLADIDADLVFIKNIDNVVPESLAAPTVYWKKVLGAVLLELRRDVYASLAELRAEDCGESALDRADLLISDRLGGEPPRGSAEQRRRGLLQRLDRPIRVCGMVPVTGEPGGGPFWVETATDESGSGSSQSVQVVEPAQVDLSDPEQARVMAASTHFNPVDLVCSTRDESGRDYELAGFVDPATAFLVAKSVAGRSLRALERPGLWNGAMAGWNTVFVEVPLETFNPVKTVNDLLRPTHVGRMQQVDNN
ncbi:MAG: DUF4301 family protein [bacterium]